MQESAGPVLNQVNLVVRDVPTSIAFWRHFGLNVEEAAHPEWARHHATVVMPSGLRLELDSQLFAKQWNPGWRPSGGNGMGVLFFQVPAADEVDRLFADVTKAGYAGQKAPEDAFWGARYAIVEDPDGNAVGIMSPIDPSSRRPPPPPPD